jgi:hypothetical protein
MAVELSTLKGNAHEFVARLRDGEPSSYFRNKLGKYCLEMSSEVNTPLGLIAFQQIVPVQAAVPACRNLVAEIDDPTVSRGRLLETTLVGLANDLPRSTQPLGTTISTNISLFI